MDQAGSATTQIELRLRARSRSALAILITLITIAGCRSADRLPPPAAPTVEFNRELNLASFDELFARISESYFKPQRLKAGPDGIDWDGTRLRLRPAVANATNMDQVRGAMSEALAGLGETHFAVVPGELYHEMREKVSDHPTTPKSGNSAQNTYEAGSVGIHVRVADGLPIVWKVDDDSSATAGNVRAGSVIESVNGDDVAPGIAQLRASFGDVPLTNVRIVEWIESRLSPPIGDSVRMQLRLPNHQARTVRLQSQARPGMWTSFGNLPSMNLRFESRQLPDGIGYFALSVFLNPPKVMPAYTAFIKANHESRGLVIDLRGNPGGLGAMATGMCGFLIANDGEKLGTMIRRDGSLQFIVNPRYPQFEGPVAVLVDQMSMSTSEILAGGLQDLGRARIFGQPTPGAALPSTIARLSNGDGLQYALADYVSASGRRLEGLGITPDDVIPLRPESLLVGRDEVLEAACTWMKSQAPGQMTNTANVVK